jgi:hypothetical protein
MERNGEDLSGKNKMSKDSKNSMMVVDVRDRRGDNGRTSTSSSGSLTLASGVGHTS